MWSRTLDRISFLALFLVVVLLPIFFLPFTHIPIEIAKGAILLVGLATSAIFWVLARFFDGKVSVPKSFGLLFLLVVVLVTLASAYWSLASKVSFFGNLFDVGSFWFVFAAFLLTLLCSMILGSRERARAVLLGVIISSAVLFIFQSLRFYFPQVLSLGTFASKLDNPFGGWSSLGIFAGLSVLISLFMMEFFSISRLSKLLLGILMLLSFFLLAAVNFVLVWKILGVSALIIFVYKVSFLGSQEGEGGEGKARFPALSFVVIMISLLCIISGQSIGKYVPNHLGLTQNEVAPSFQSTLLITKGVLKHDPLLGMGPNMFKEAWALYKPKEINNTLFWNTTFGSGSSLFFTIFATLGALGTASWLLFLGTFLYSGAKSIFSNLRDGLNIEMVVFFISALYLFISSFFYFTGSAIFLLSMAFTGIFIGLYAGSKEGGVYNILFLNDHRKSFFFILAFMLVVILSAGFLFKYGERFASVFYFQRALVAKSVPDIETPLKRAVSLYPNDLYLRSYADVLLVKLNSQLSKNSQPTDEQQKESQAVLDQALASASFAVEINPANYLNFLELGQIYTNTALLKVKSSYEHAVEAYNTALVLNPLNPITDFYLARVSLASGKAKEAKDYLNQALDLKADYTDALLLLSQTYKNEGNPKDALTYAERALASAPNNTDIMQYTTSLKNSANSAPKEENPKKSKP